MIPRCLLIFEQSCKSKKTFRDYKMNLDYFLKFSHKDHESLLLLPQIELEELLQDYCIFLKKRAENDEISPNSVPYFFNGIFKFLKINRKIFDRSLITELYPPKKKLGGGLAITTEQCKMILDCTAEKRDKALIHFFSATGARPEAVCELRLKHVEPYQEEFFKIVLYAEDGHEMVTFLHPEASKALSNYFEWRKSKGEVLSEDSPVFRSNSSLASISKPKLMTMMVMQNIMFRLWHRSGIKRIKTGKRFDLASTTSFRKRFDTILEFNHEVSMGVTQYLMDHDGYMSGRHYRRPTVEQVFQEYKKVCLELMISDEWRLRLELEKNDDESKDKRIDFLEEKLSKVETLLLELKSRV